MVQRRIEVSDESHLVSTDDEDDARPHGLFERGVDFLEDKAPYSTPRIIKVGDWRMSCINIFVKIAIFVYIVIYKVLYNCSHLVRVPTRGAVRMSIQEPTMGCNPMKPDCLANFSDLTALPYCTKYTGTVKPAFVQHKCQNFDAVELTDRTPVPNSLFVPTRITSLPQNRQCDRHATHCPQVWSESTTKSTVYAANVERFTVLIDHSYFATDSHRGIYNTGYAGNHKGAWEVCHNASVRQECEEMRIPCANQECRDLIMETGFGPDMPNYENEMNPWPTMTSILGGDIISIGELMKIATTGMAGPEGPLDSVRAGNNSVRDEGCIVIIEIHYANFAHWAWWGNQPKTYKYAAHMMPARTFKILNSRHDSTDGYMSRTIKNVHGIQFVARIEGEFVFWSTMRLLVVTTVAMTLLALSSTLTDFLGTYVFHNKFRRLKYFQTPIGLSKIREEVEDVEGEARFEDELDNHRAGMVHSAHMLTRCLKNTEKQLPADQLIILLAQHEERLNYLDSTVHEERFLGTMQNGAASPRVHG